MRYAKAAMGLLAAAALAGCGATGTIERRIESELQRQLGPADSYEVTLEGLDKSAGRADEVLAIGYGVRPRHGPALERIDLALYDVQYDRDRNRLEHADSTRATVWVSGRDLALYLETIEGIGSATVTFEAPNVAHIRMRPAIAGIPLPPGATANVTGKMVADGPELRFEVTEVSAAGLHATEGMVRHISQLINPLVDLTDIPLNLEVTGVAVENRAARVDATGSVTSFSR